MNLAEPFETDRLKFRLLEPSDVEDVLRQFSDADMCRYFGDPPMDRNEALETIEHYSDPIGKGYLRYGMFDKNSDRFVGTCGYHYWDRNLKQVEIGYDIWKEYWRQGYVSEALPVLLEICFRELCAEWVYVLVYPENEASIASVRRLGFDVCEPCRTPEDDNLICMKLHISAWDKQTKTDEKQRVRHQL